MAGADRAELGSGDDHARGGEGADTLVGGAGRDVLFGEGGDDMLHAHAERDPLAALALGQSQSPDDGERGQQRVGTGNRGIEARGTPPIRKSPSACKPPIAANDFHGRVAA